MSKFKDYIPDNRKTAKALFLELDVKRTQKLEIGRLSSLLTIPNLLPPAGHSPNQELARPKQGFGARCINSLAAKLLLALFPTNTPFFKFTLTREAKEELSDEEITDYQKTLARIEADTITNLEASNMRSALSVALKYQPCIGDSCIRIDKDGDFRVYRMDSYVVERDSTGVIIDAVIRESSSLAALDPKLVANHFNEEDLKKLKNDRTEEVEMYIHMYREGKRYKVYQEINGRKVQGSEGSYPLDAPEFVVSRWSHIVGDDYGTGMVEEYLPDFVSLNGYSGDMRKASAAAAKVIFAINSGSMIRKKDLTTAESGDVINGNAADVNAITIDKANDFRVTQEQMEIIKRELSQIFLMNSSVSRDAERVTAEEIRYIAQELEDGLGGVYSGLAHELQKPLLNRYLYVLRKKGLIPELPKDGVDQQITTGLEALGRGHDVNKLVTFLTQLTNAIGQEKVASRINDKEVADRLATGIGIEIDSLIKSDDDVQKEREVMNAEALTQSTAPGAVNELIKQNSNTGN